MLFLDLFLIFSAYLFDHNSSFFTPFSLSLPLSVSHFRFFLIYLFFHFLLVSFFFFSFVFLFTFVFSLRCPLPLLFLLYFILFSLMWYSSVTLIFNLHHSWSCDTKALFLSRSIKLGAYQDKKMLWFKASFSCHPKQKAIITLLKFLSHLNYRLYTPYSWHVNIVPILSSVRIFT